MRTIRIPDQTLITLRELSEERGQSIPEVVANAVQLFRRQHVLGATNDAYARLQDDSMAWERLQQEYGEWDEMLSDGLEDA